MRFRGWMPLWVAWLVFLVPLTVDLVVSGPARAFGWVAPDTFYYLVYAQRTLTSGVVSFDGEHASNGFHPLWMLVVTLIQALRGGEGDYKRLYDLIAVGALLQLVALGLLARVFRSAQGRLTPWFAALPVGLYAVLVSPAWLRLSRADLRAQNLWQDSEPVYGTMWTFVNGMETSALVASYAALMFACCATRMLETRRGAAGIGALLALLTFARLDHVFFASAIWLLCSLRCLLQTRALERWLALTLTFSGLVLVYLAANHHLFGSALPVSGRVKSSFPIINTDNFVDVARALNGLVGEAPAPIWVVWRVAQSLVPVLFALATPLAVLSFRAQNGQLLVRWAGREKIGQFLLATAVGVLVLATYDACFVAPHHTGNWYLPVSQLFVSLWLLFVLDRFSAPATSMLQSKWMRAAVAAACVAGTLAFFLRLHRHTDGNERYARFYFEEKDALRQAFRGREPKLLCFDDGIVAFTTGFSTMSATGLSADLEAANALRAGRLLPLALDRGFDHLTSLVYVDHAALRETPPNLAAWASATSKFGSLDGVALEPAYVSQTMSFAIVRAQRSSARDRERVTAAQ